MRAVGANTPTGRGSAKMGADANDKVYYLIVEDGVTMTRVTAFGIESDIVHKQRSQRCHPSALHVYSWHQLVADERGYLIFFYMKYLYRQRSTALYSNSFFFFLLSRNEQIPLWS